VFELGVNGKDPEAPNAASTAKALARRLSHVILLSPFFLKHVTVDFDRPKPTLETILVSPGDRLMTAVSYRRLCAFAIVERDYILHIVR
jgi:hypothetical protein